ARTIIGLRAFDQTSGEGVLRLLLKAIILLPRFCLTFGLAPAAARNVKRMHAPPTIQGRVARGNLGVEISVGKVQVPIRVFYVAHQIPNSDFEISQRYVSI